MAVKNNQVREGQWNQDWPPPSILTSRSRCQEESVSDSRTLLIPSMWARESPPVQSPDWLRLADEGSDGRWQTHHVTETASGFQYRPSCSSYKDPIIEAVRIFKEERTFLIRKMSCWESRRSCFKSSLQLQEIMGFLRRGHMPWGWSWCLPSLWACCGGWWVLASGSLPRGLPNLNPFVLQKIHNVWETTRKVKYLVKGEDYRKHVGSLKCIHGASYRWLSGGPPAGQTSLSLGVTF